MNPKLKSIAAVAGVCCMLWTGASQAAFTNKTEDDIGTGFLAQADITPNPPYYSGWTMARYINATARDCLYWLEAKNASTQQWTTFDSGAVNTTYLIVEDYWLSYYDTAFSYVWASNNDYAYAEIWY
jgi:hypothetical protein